MLTVISPAKKLDYSGTQTAQPFTQPALIAVSYTHLTLPTTPYV